MLRIQAAPRAPLAQCAAITHDAFVSTILKSGQTVGGYQIQGLLGKGGMGEVYHAVQVSMQRAVALKVLSPKLAAKDPSFCQKFIDEARAAGRLNHPNIIHVHDVSHDTVDGQTVYYFSMELVDGENYRTIVERDGALSLKDVAHVMKGACDALIYAEQSGIVHRDIKPENIMLTKEGVIKVADLGLAMDIDSSQEAVERNAEGKVRVMGTPRYMSPEQARGHAVDFRSDQYCLGASLFHLLTGDAPFHGKTSKDLMRAHVLEPAPSATERLETVPENWSAFCQRLMAKQPDDRYASAQLMRQDLDRIISGGSPGESFKSQHRLERQRRGNKKKSLVLVGAVAGILALAGIAAVVVTGGNEENAPDAPVTANNGSTSGNSETPDNTNPNAAPGNNSEQAQVQSLINELPSDPVLALARVQQAQRRPEWSNNADIQKTLTEETQRLQKTHRRQQRS